jgi:three-Cys-motif partner protein
MSSGKSSQLKLDEVGEWSETKLDIIRKYAHAYTTILTKYKLSPIYIDGFAGAGEHISRATREKIKGSPSEAFDTRPPFASFHLVDLEGTRAEALRTLAAGRTDTKIYHGDCNRVLLEKVFPEVSSSRFNRALCILDPYGLHLDWEVMEAAGKTGQIEIFLNFPVADMHRNVFWHKPDGVDPKDIERMNRFWGDNSWNSTVYTTRPTLFEELTVKEADSTRAIAKAFQNRLKEKAGFKFVPEPAPMCNSKGAVVYYLFFATPNKTADGIVTDILNKHRREGRI